MGLSGISFPQLLILLVIVMLIFGTKRLSDVGSDLGKAVKNFRKAMEDNTPETKQSNIEVIKKDSNH